MCFAIVCEPRRRWILSIGEEEEKNNRNRKNNLREMRENILFLLSQFSSSSPLYSSTASYSDNDALLALSLDPILVDYSHTIWRKREKLWRMKKLCSAALLTFMWLIFSSFPSCFRESDAMARAQIADKSVNKGTIGSWGKFTQKINIYIFSSRREEKENLIFDNGSRFPLCCRTCLTLGSVVCTLLLDDDIACWCAAGRMVGEKRREHKNVIKYSKHYSWYYFHA